MESLQKKLGLFVRQKRKEAGLSQKELAHFMRVDQARISRIETGEAHMLLSEWTSFCRIVGIHPMSFRNERLDYGINSDTILLCPRGSRKL